MDTTTSGYNVYENYSWHWAVVKMIRAMLERGGGKGLSHHSLSPVVSVMQSTLTHSLAIPLVATYTIPVYRLCHEGV